MTELLNDYQNKKLQAKLIEKYSSKKELNTAFSLRAFSKKIGISSGALSEILQDKRKLTFASAKKVLQNLNYSEVEIENFLNETKPSKVNNRKYHDLNMDQYEVLSNWYYLALLNFLELPNEKTSFEAIASRFNITPKKAEEAINRLLRLEMIEEKNGRYKRTFIRYQTSEDVANSAIRKYHEQTLALSEEALKNTEVELRDFSSIVLKINPKNLKNVKNLIRKFQDDISELVEEDNPEEVYHMNVHLYPVTTPKSKSPRGQNVK